MIFPLYDPPEPMPEATRDADRVYWYQPAGLDWEMQDVVDASSAAAELCSETGDMVQRVVADARSGDTVRLKPTRAWIKPPSKLHSSFSSPGDRSACLRR